MQVIKPQLGIQDPLCPPRLLIQKKSTFLSLLPSLIKPLTSIQTLSLFEITLRDGFSEFLSTFPNSLLIGGNTDSQPITFEKETNRENNYFNSAIAPTIINQVSSQLVVKKQAKSQTNKKPNKSTKSKKAAKPRTAQLEPINSMNSFANSETPNQASLTVTSKSKNLKSDRTSEPSSQNTQADTLTVNISQPQNLGSDRTVELSSQNTQANTAPSIDNVSQAQDLRSDRTSDTSSQNKQADTAPSIDNFSQPQEIRSDRTIETSSQQPVSPIANVFQAQDLKSDRTVEPSSQNKQANTAPSIVNISEFQQLRSDRTSDTSLQSKQADTVPPIDNVSHPQEIRSDRTPETSLQSKQADTAPPIVNVSEFQQLRSDRTIETSSQNKQANTAPPIDNFSQAQDLRSDRTIETSSQQPVSPIVNVDQQQEMKSDRTSDISSQNTQASTTQQSVSPEIVMKQSDVRANNYLVVQSPNNITIENTTKIAKESSQTEVEKDSLFDNPLPPKGYAIGGQVTASNSVNHQQIAPSDTVPAMLTPGEFVVNAKDAQKNLNLLKHINNSGTIPDLSTNNVNAVGTSAQVKTATDSAVQRQSLDTTKIKPLGYLVSSSLGKETANHHLITLSTLQLKTYENQANKQTKNSTHYSSTPLIFRKPVSTANTSFKPNTQSAQWLSSEEFMSSEKINRISNNFNPDISSDDALRRQQPPAYTKSKVHIDTASNLIQPKSFAKDKEAVVTDKTTITETIERNSSQLNQSSEINSVEFEKLARDVYQLLRRRLENEQERHGILSGRLPW